MRRNRRFIDRQTSGPKKDNNYKLLTTCKHRLKHTLSFFDGEGRGAVLIFAAMHYVTAENLSKSYGIKPLFQNITFHISEGDKIALVARNGSGKSTLLKIIAGKETAEEGKVWISKDVDLAFFEQEPQLVETATTLDNIFHTAHPIMSAIR